MALILIVDDSPTEVFVMQKALEKHGFKTAAAENGEEGVRKAREMKPDLIFMDIVMPGVNGYQATRMLLNDPVTSVIPIIMVTTKGQETDRVWGLRQGAVDYLVKPVSAQALVEKAQSSARYMTTMSEPDNSLRSLRDRPFELLKELEKRSRAVTPGSVSGAETAKEWVGVAFRMGGETFLVAREETREVLGYPAAVTRIPGAKTWVKGLANVRGQLLPLLDLRQFLGSGATASGRNTRIIVVNHRDVPAGLMVDEVLGFRRFAESDFNPDPPPTVIRCDAYLAGAFRRGGEVWPVLSLKSLVESQSFLQAAS